MVNAYYSPCLFDTSVDNMPGIIRLSDNGTYIQITAFNQAIPDTLLNGKEIVAIIQLAIPMLEISECRAIFDALTADEQRAKAMADFATEKATASNDQ